MIESQRRSGSPPGRSHKEALANEVGLGHRFNGLRFLANRNSQCGKTHRPSPKPRADRFKHGAIEPVQPAPIDFEDVECRTGGFEIEHPASSHLRPILHPS